MWRQRYDVLAVDRARRGEGRRMTSARREQRRLLGLRRAVHFSLASQWSTSPEKATVPEYVVVKAGTKPEAKQASA